MNLFKLLRNKRKVKQPSKLMLKVEDIDDKLNTLVLLLASKGNDSGSTPPQPGTTDTDFEPFEPFAPTEEQAE